MNHTLLVLSLLTGVLASTTTFAAPMATPVPPTLDTALHAMHPLPNGVALAVGAEKVSLPKGAAAPDPGDAPGDVADAFGMITQSFGRVLAVAPSTMTIVYAPPETPNPYDGMPPGQVLKMLARTYTPLQWKAFMSDAGVGYSTMQPGMQQSLFQALFPGGHLVAQFDNPTGPNDPAAKRDISGNDLLQAHLRIGYTVDIALPEVGKQDTHLFSGSWDPPSAPPVYFMMNSQGEDVDHEYGATVRATVPNIAKLGILPIIPDTVAVPLAGLKTVDNLLARISALSHCEIYADPRYGVRFLTVVGTLPSAPGGSLLQAVALCVGGTYRKVGPVYVLTNDTIGLGTKHARWKAFEEKAGTMLAGHDQNSEWTPVADVPFTTQDISFRGDPLAYTLAQQALYWKKQETGGGMLGGGGMLQLELPFSQLSPAQQEAAEHIQANNEKRHSETSLDGDILLQAEADLQIVLPMLDGPVLVFQSYPNLLPAPAAVEAAQQKQMQANFPEMAPEPMSLPPSGIWKRTLANFPRRAVRLAPADVPGLTHMLALAHAIGFNEVWLQFKPGGTSPALLAQAVAEGKPLGIRVLPEVSFLRWQDAPRSLLDVDVLGDTPTEADALTSDHPFGGPQDTVTPFSPAVAERLRPFLSTLASTPGIGGMVWDGFVPPGYTNSRQDTMDSSHPALGYTESGRVAFLRAAHADPMDLYDNSYTDERAHDRVPEFDERDFDRTQALFKRWSLVRSRAAIGLAQTFAATLPASFRGTAPLPVLVSPTNEQYLDLYGSWDDRQADPPAMHFIDRRGPDGKILMGVPVIETMPSRLLYHVVGVYAPHGRPAASVLGNALRSLQEAARSGTRNIVCGGGATSPDMLENLSAALSAAEAPPAQAAH